MSGNNENIVNQDLPRNDQSREPVPFVAPLNSVPYVDPSSSRVSISEDRVEVFDSDDYLFFRVSLPGVANDQNTFSCDIEDNDIVIKGVSTLGEPIVYKYSQIFVMRTRNVCPPSLFTIKFKLPSPVYKEELSWKLEFGLLEGKVTKRRSNSGPGPIQL